MGEMDTTGEVWWPGPEGHSMEWSDLTPFEQGYTRAAFESLRDACPDCGGRGEVGGWRGGVASIDGGGGYDSEPCPCLKLGFSDIAPDTLAAIRRECSGYQTSFGRGFPDAAQRRDGGLFWALSSRGNLPRNPPLTPYLGDDGKVYLRPPTQGLDEARVISTTTETDDE